MSAFDPYYRWLGIPPEEQPPHHYRLLGVATFESDPEVIGQAADQRMAYLRKVQIGPHGSDSQRLLNEIAAARRCLLSAQHRPAYDAQLRAKLAPQAPASPPLPSVGPPLVPGSGPFLPPGGPLHPPTVLPIGMPLASAQPVPPGVPLAPPAPPAFAVTPQDDDADPLAALASAEDTLERDERRGRRSKNRRARRPAASKLGAYSLVLLVLSVVALGVVVWYRTAGRNSQLVASGHTGDSKSAASARTGKVTAEKQTAASGPGHAPSAAADQDRRPPASAQQPASPAPSGQPAKPPAPAKPPQPSRPPASLGAAGADPNPSKGEGFRPLFNGVDLTGWRTHPAQPGAWRVENGVLIASGAGTTHLFTDREDFRNVYVRASTRVSRDSNGGIFVRSSYGAKPPAPLPHGYEARVFGNKVNSGTLRCYAPNQIIFPSPKPIDQPDDWLTLEFRVVESELTSLINGQELCSATDPQRLFDHGLIAVQFRGPPNGTASSKIEFRSIEIKELPLEQQARN